MSILTVVLPVVGQPDSTEDPKVSTALTAIQTWANGNVGTSNIQANTVTGAMLLDGGWVSLSGFYNSWVSNGGPGGGATAASRLTAGVVRLGGSLASGINGNMFTLPAGSRPPYTLVFQVANGSGVAGDLLTIPTSGVASISLASATSGIVYLDGISFPIN